MTQKTQVLVSLFHYQKLQAEHKQLLDTVCDIATKSPYQRSYVEAIYQCRGTLKGVTLNHDWTQYLAQDP